MREIKFRAWDRLEYKFVYSNKASDFGFWKWVAYDDTTPLMQYTGLKDKNGVEIYEGDIITATTNYGLKMKPHSVEYVESLAAYVAQCEGAAMLLKEVGNYKVIGNVYEEPELLEKTS